jgi:hypothetical protein
MGRTVVEIGGLRFPTKKAAEEFFKAMLYRYETGSPIPEPDATHLGWLLERHPEHRVKIGNGIDRFVVLNTLWGARGFAVLRCDGSAETFSSNPLNIKTLVGGAGSSSYGVTGRPSCVRGTKCARNGGATLVEGDRILTLGEIENWTGSNRAGWGGPQPALLLNPEHLTVNRTAS